MATAIYQGQNFFAPYFEIKLQGQNLGHQVLRDVLQVSYQDDLENLDSFDFTLHDWDPVALSTRYSSPFDESGQLRKMADSTFDVPNFEPGAKVELYMGYYGGDKPLLMMVGKVASASVNFPASGNPTLTVRVLNLLFDLQRSQQSLTFENQTPTEIARTIASDLDIELQSAPGTNEQVIDFIGMNNEYPILFLARLARRNGYDLFVNIEDENDPKLFFGLRQTSPQQYELEWGKTLMQFTPTLKLKDQVQQVIVRGWNPTASGSDRAIEGQASWSDLDIQMPDAKLLEQIEFAANDAIEEITDQPVSSQQAADALAQAALRRIVQGVITGKGNTVGLPMLRAGSRLLLKGLGLRYSHNYIVTESVHKIDDSGYTTEFTARMEVVSG
ncbi:MAG: hypothetical protein KKE94_17580 [Gammaproteobacteria bacterium]|nr:hypothetical protein [Gammaproteobacteria bacterium]